MVNQFKITFVLDKEKGKDDCKLRMRIRWGTETVAVNLGYRINPDRWDMESQRCHRNSSHGKDGVSASVINREIQRYEDIARQVTSPLPVTTSADMVRTLLRSALGKKNESGQGGEAILLSLISSQAQKKGWAINTIKDYTRLVKRLKEWKNGFRISDLDKNGIESFARFYVEKGLKHLSVSGYVGHLKCLLRYLDESGIPVPPDYRKADINVKVLPHTVIWLEWDELMTLYKFKPEDDVRRVIKDFFLFSCFTGLRQSDVRNLRKIDIQDDCVKVSVQKTGAVLNINLNKYSRAIVKRNMGNPTDKLFDAPGTTYVCMLIKEICHDAGIVAPVTSTYMEGGQRLSKTDEKWKFISMHSGRRTFICNALSLGISPQVVMRWTGHRNYNSMKPYIDIAEKSKSDAMKLFDKK